MGDAYGVDQHLPRTKRHSHGLALVDLDRDFLAPRQHVVGMEGIVVGQRLLRIASRQDAHAAALYRCW